MSGTWTNMTGKTNVTSATGAYNITKGDALAGTYQYRTIYAGSAIYTNATSNVVSVTVKASTALNATAPTTTTATTNFTIKGTLTSSGTPLKGQSITLQRSTDNKT